MPTHYKEARKKIKLVIRFCVISRYQTVSLEEQGTRHRLSGDHWRQASDSQLFTSWVNPEQEARPCRICSRAFGMDTGR